MLISEFITGFKVSKQQNAYVKKHIKTNYIPYETKIALSKKIVDLSMYKEVNGKKVFVQNTPNRYMLFIQAVIDNYTDLEWNGEDGSKDILGGFNQLEKNGIIEILFSSIGDDIQKFTTVLNMIVDDETDLNRSVVSYMDTKIEALSIMLDTISQAFNTPEIKDKIVEFVQNGVDTVQS